MANKTRKILLLPGDGIGPEVVAEVKRILDHSGKDILAVEAFESGMVTFIPDDIDWEEEVRIAIEERSSFSPDA